MKKLFLLMFAVCCTFLLVAQTSKTVNLTAAGALSSTLSATELTTVTNLTLTGQIDARDFKTMRDGMTALSVIDLSGATIVAYSGTLGTNGTGYQTYAANTIPASAFDEANYPTTLKLSNIILGNSITAIGRQAFYLCSTLTSITLPSSLTTIGDWAFQETKIPTITLPATVSSIGAGAFAVCSTAITVTVENPYLTCVDGVLYNKNQTTIFYCPITKAGDFVIPNTVTTINGGGFARCTALKTITFPKSVTTIAEYAFQSCSNLVMYIYNPSVIVADGSFFNAATSVTAYVPAGSKTAYQANTVWNAITIKEMDIANNTTNKALNFDGVDDYVNVGNKVDFSKSFTFETWVKPSTKSVWSVIAACDYENAAKGFQLFVSSGTVWFKRSSGSYSVGKAISLDVWHHVAAVYDGAKIELFVDGVSAGTSTITIPNAVNDLYIGARHQNDGTAACTDYFIGSIDEVRIWNTARTSAQIQAYMNTPIVNLAGESNLVAYYNFDQGTANGVNTGETTLIDKSANPKNGTLNNFTLVGTTSNFVPRNAPIAYFPLDTDGRDATGNGNDVTAKSNCTFSQTGLLGSKACSITDGYLAAADYTKLGLVGTSFTISMWIKPADLNSCALVSKYNWNGAPLYGYYLEFGGGKILMHVGPGSTQTLLATDAVITANKWYFVVARLDVASQKLFVSINDSLKYVTPCAATNISTSNLFQIGKYNADANTYNGLMKDVRIYNQAISDEEISQLYHQYNPTLSVSTTNNALAFDGKDDYASLSSPVSTAFTIEYWMKTTQKGTSSPENWYGGIGIVDAEYSNINTDFGTSLLGDKLCLGIGSPDISIKSNSVVNTGQWVHVAATWQNNGELKLYINGVLESSLTGVSTVSRSISTIRLGTLQTFANGYFAGELDEVRIWKIARTQAEIVANMNKSITTKTDNLLVNYTFDKGIANGLNSNILADESGNTTTYPGTLTNLDLSAGNSTSNYTYGAPLTYPATTSPITLVLAKAQGSTGVARVTSTTTWTAASDASWLTLSPGTSMGNGLLTITAVTANPTNVIRTALVSVSAPNTPTQTISVTQEAGDATLSVSTTNNALAFDGTEDYVQLPAGNYFTGIGLTLEAWVYFKSYTNFARIAEFGNGQNNENIIFSLNAMTGRPDLSLTSYGVGSNNPASTPVPLNQWTHLAYVLDGRNIKIYMNGNEILNTTTNIQFRNIERTLNYIGKSNWLNEPSYPNAIFDEIRVWNKARTQADIIATMNRSLKSETNLILNYTFNQGSPNVLNTGITALVDSSASAINGTLKNFTLNGTASNWTTGAPLQYTAAANLKIAKEASTSYAAVTSNTAWTATETADWLSITPSTTSGNGVLTITATANPTIAERKATITVTATGVPQQTITVTQAAGDATLSIATTNYNVPKETTVTKLTVGSNASINVTKSDSWLQVDISGLNVNITALANTTSASRTATVTVSTISGSPTKTQTITINQAAGNAALTVIPSQDIAFTAAKTTVTVTSNAKWTASLTAPSDWLTVTTSSGTNNGSLVFTTATNTTVDPRSATITIAASGEIDNITKMLTVTQAAGVPILAFSAKSLSLNKVKTDTATVLVTSNTSWTASSSDQTWLTVSPSEATGNGKLTFTAQTNTTISERTAQVFLKTTKGSPEKFDTIVVTQAKGDSTLTIEKDSLSIGKIANSRVAVKVNANFGFENDTMKLPWFTRIITKDSLIFIATQVNPLSINRDTSIVVSIAKLSKLIKVTQLNSDPFVTIGTKDIKIDSKAHDSIVSVKANVDWEISGNANWVSYTRKKNAQNDSIVFIIAANPTIVSRICDLTITPQKGNPQTITVTQAAGDTTFSLSSTSASVEKKDSTLHITVFSNTAWSIESNASWLTIDATTGNDTAQRVLTVAANNTVVDRSATLTAKAVGATMVSFTVNQKAGDSVLTIKRTDTIANSAASYVLPVTTNVDWKVSKKATWLSITENVDSTKLDFTVTENKTIYARIDTLILRAGTFADSVIVYQHPSDTLVSIAQTGLNSSKAGGTITIAVESNDSSWNVSKKYNWLTASKHKSKDSLVITVDTNKTILSRVDTLWVSAGTKHVAVVIAQEKGDASLLVNKTAMKASDTLFVTANIAWTAKSSAEWLSVKINDNQVTFSAATNPTVNERSASVRFTSIDSTITRFVSVSQAAGDSTLSMKDTSLLFDNKVLTKNLVIITNTQPHIKNLPTWIKANQSDSLLVVTVQSNTATIARKDSFTVSVQGISKTIVVEQAAGDTVFNVSGSVYKLAANVNLSKTLAVTSNASLTLTTTNNSWLRAHFDSPSTESTTYSLSSLATIQFLIEADTNKTLSSRKDSIFISSGTYKTKIVVEQDAAIGITTVNDTSIYLGKTTKDYVFANIFNYQKRDSIRYKVSFSQSGIVNLIAVNSIADKDSAFALFCRSLGTTNVHIKATSTWGTVAETSFTLNVKNNTCFKVDSIITPVVCAGDSTGCIIVKAIGGAKPYTYEWSNYSTNDTVRNLASGIYSVTITDSLECRIDKTYSVLQTKPIKIVENISAPTTCNAADGSITLSVSDGNGNYRYKWDDGSEQSSVTNKKNGDYTVTVTDAKSCKLSKSIHISDKDAPKITVNSIKSSLCKKATGSIDISVVDNGSYTVLWSNTSTEVDQVNLLPGKYWVRVLSGMCKDSVIITVPSDSIHQPELSLVTLDSTFTNNLVVWMREQTEAIDFYHIYRDSGLIATVPYNQISVYKDTSLLVKPFKQSYSYQISALNTCGRETSRSNAFRTIHLQAYRALNKSANELIWEDYGGSVQSRKYTVYRKDGDSWNKIDSLVNGRGFTDENPGDARSYYVAIDLPFEVRPSLFKTDTGPFSQSMSNMSEASLVDSKTMDAGSLRVYPNPSNGQFTVELVGNEGAEVALVADNGAVVAKTRIEGQVARFNQLHVASGLYTVQVQTDRGSITKLVIIH